MKSLFEIGDDYRLVPAGTVIFDAGHTVIKALEDTVIARLFIKERDADPPRKELGHVLGGKIEIVVDAIIHTREGAAGESVEKTVASLAMRTVDGFPFEELGTAPAGLVERAFPDMEITVARINDSIHVKGMSIEVDDWRSPKKACIIYAPVGEKRAFVLVVEGEKRVIVDEPAVYVVTKKEYVAVKADGVHITSRSGKVININSGFPGRILDRVFTGIRRGFDFDFDFDDCFDFDFDFDIGCR